MGLRKSLHERMFGQRFRESHDGGATVLSPPQAGGLPDAAARATAAGPGDAVRYLAIVAATIVVTSSAYVAALDLLELGKMRPPPALSNSLCLDAKLEYLRDNPPVVPTHLIIGSSISWRNIDAAAIVRANGEARPLNGGFCGLRMNQTAFVTRFLLERYPSISDLLLLLDPLDMSACHVVKSEVFDPQDAAAYLSGAAELKYYFRYFDPYSLLGNAIHLKERKADLIPADPLVFTQYGDGPLGVAPWQGIQYGRSEALDPKCQRALADLAKDVSASGRKLLVVTMPVLPEWSKQFDPRGSVRHQLADAIHLAVQGTSAGFWDAWTTESLPLDGYVDAYHLRWNAARRFTERLIGATGFGMRDH